MILIAAFVAILPIQADAADDGFGGPYFTAQAPAALGDNNNTIALSEPDAAAAAAIEPASGDVFTLPEDPALLQDQVSEDDYDYDSVE